jgi:hypothetical protein
MSSLKRGHGVGEIGDRKRPKHSGGSVPASFFDSDESKQVNSARDEEAEEEEWQRFQTDISSIKTAATDVNATSIHSSGVIEAAPVPVEEEPEAEQNDPEDLKPDEERTLAEFDKQRELYDRVEKMRQRLKEHKQLADQNGVHQNHGSIDSGYENGQSEESDDDDADLSMWRRRQV